MGTTSSGLRYPEPSEPVNQGAQNLRNLAEDVTGKYLAAPWPGGAMFPDGAVAPAGTVLQCMVGKINVTTDSQGQAVIQFPFTASVMQAAIVTPAVSYTLPKDYVMSVAPRGANSMYVYVMNAGVKLASTAVGISYIVYYY